MFLILCLMAAAEEDAPEWSVDAPPGPRQQVDIDVTAGTWMSLDVSPDGQQLVFDLLGDLYLMPISGGEATALTSGMAWDMQPTFAPDGRSVAFTSDRGGGDNLWVIDLDSRAATAITEESFRLVSSPAWHPSGDYLVGRKHFTGFRSLGSGEMWMYPLTGGPGIQLTEKPNEQQDAGEPTIADGYLYWSQDLSGGSSFQYNKDPNPGIYGIKRKDLVTGDIERVTKGAGGACRPTVHGDTLAFVRRVRDRSVLYLRDMTSGAERPLWDGLDRDMQETWAIHGTYPRMAWLPDGSGLVAWAQGGLWQIDLDGAATAIPFHVADTREIRQTHRVSVAVAPDTFDVRMLRGARVSPDGEQVVFSALGRLYITDTTGGTPRRLTREDGVMEQDPAWSPDGRSIVYVTWSDADLGTVRQVSARGGRGKVLSTTPGHFRQPMLHTDGSVFVERISGGWLRSPLHGLDTGIVRIDRDGEETITVDGGTPQPIDDVLYFEVDGDKGSTELHAIDLLTGEERTVAVAATGQDLRISPDGQHVAFVEGQTAYVQPLPLTGGALELSRDGRALPVARVSADDVFSLHFSDDTTLAYTLGPELFAVDIAAALAGERAEESVAPQERGTPLGWSEPLSRPGGVAAIVGAKIVTMVGEEVIEDGVVVWEDDRIVGVGARGSVIVPEEAHIIDGTGLTVLPGLIDAHAHGGQASGGIIPQQNWKNLATLAFGVTTTHDPSNNTETVFAAAELQQAGLILAPRIFSTGTILYGAKAPGAYAEVNDLDDALRHLRRRAAVGAVSVKSYNQPRRDQRQQIMEAARQVGLNVVPEGGSTLMHNLTMIVDGHTGIEHSLPVAEIYADVVQLWSATQVGYTPTLGVAYGGLMGENYWYAKTDVWAHPRLQTFVPREVLDPASRRSTLVPDDEYNHIQVAQIAATLADAGVGVQIGAHGQREGLASHWELWMLVQGGMTPHRALQSGTLDGAVYLGMEADLGSLEVGKLADLMVVEGDPLTDIRLSDQVRYTVLGGRAYDAATMGEIWPAQAEREPLYWQTEAFGGEPSHEGCSCGRN
ncbi:MAG: amidohydrolase family protein [Myxococcota bacterium]|nr:amidohydrolase family protein [Myxococcota bacterium]